MGSTVTGIASQPGSGNTLMFTYTYGSNDFAIWKSFEAPTRILTAVRVDFIEKDDPSALTAPSVKTGSFYLAGRSTAFPSTTNPKDLGSTSAAVITHAWKWEKTCDSYQSTDLSGFTFTVLKTDTNIPTSHYDDGSGHTDIKLGINTNDLTIIGTDFGLTPLSLSF